MAKKTLNDSIGHQDSRNLSVQVNWLSNNGLPGLEPRGLLPTCVLIQRVSHGGSVSSELNWHMTCGHMTLHHGTPESMYS